jgi:hypothetical protein
MPLLVGVVNPSPRYTIEALSHVGSRLLEPVMELLEEHGPIEAEFGCKCGKYLQGLFIDKELTALLSAR